MFRKYQTKNSSKSVLDVQKLHPLVIDLNEESQESIRWGITASPRGFRG